ncbi:hypothetical protein Strop_3738 [Salinispora tropica CNB-440]|uniref:Uncharacterized protein n=2 Tax=Salinispora tropica TaxID=168695 RepID=A4XB70_SALTO|nr:hypothetical protein Strop_3738 [Salinispora tropica CNB-440]
MSGGIRAAHGRDSVGTRRVREVAPMEIYRNARPMVLPAATASLPAVQVALITARPSVPQVHQAEVQAELTLTLAPFGNQETSGVTGKGVDSAKRRTDVRGVPPRGRPV